MSDKYTKGTVFQVGEKIKWTKGQVTEVLKVEKDTES